MIQIHFSSKKGLLLFPLPWILLQQIYCHYFGYVLQLNELNVNLSYIFILMCRVIL
ncbi:hypothetical protein IC582_019480 [Cucumis melo]